MHEKAPPFKSKQETSRISHNQKLRLEKQQQQPMTNKQEASEKHVIKVPPAPLFSV